jgi:hypothetical protein
MKGGRRCSRPASIFKRRKRPSAPSAPSAHESCPRRRSHFASLPPASPCPPRPLQS